MTGLGTKLTWIAADQNASRLCIWLMGSDFSILDKRIASVGAELGGVEGFEQSLLNLIGEELPEGRSLPVFYSGLSEPGSPFVATPCKPPSLNEVRNVATRHPALDVYAIPGVKQVSPTDVMCGPETQIAGFLAQNPKFDGVLCLPGHHSRWVRVSAEEIVSFQTFMTGEMYSLLSKKSVLQQAVYNSGWDSVAFNTAVDDAMSRPASVAALLFGLHADSLVNDVADATAQSRLFGLLIGLELAAARPYWLGQMVTVLGAAEIAEIYREGLAGQGQIVSVLDGDSMALAGLSVAYKALLEQV